ncbi:MAG: hypothetical protein HY264_11700 [Chloroflexi bacterium]|nr:hypothetical protein [Chloroflexota bacterium]
MRNATIRRALLMLLATIAIAGCGRILQGSPEPTPMSFPSMAGEFTNRGVRIANWTSGDAGCRDATLIPTAIGFDAGGLGMDPPARLRIYIFGTGAAYDRRRADVDACVSAWAADPATVEFVDARPFVIAGQGPWPPAFKSAIRAALVAAAGNGG